MQLEITYDYTQSGQIGCKHKSLVVSLVKNGTVMVKVIKDDLFLAVGEDGSTIASVDIPIGGRIVKVTAETSNPVMPVKYEDLRDPVFNEIVKPVKMNVDRKSGIIDWYDYDKRKSLTHPSAGTECEYLGCANRWDKCKIVFTSEYVIVIEGKAVLNELVQVAFNFGNWPEFRPLDHDRKAKAERKKVVDAAYEASTPPSDMVSGKIYDALEQAYNKGFLRMPD